MSLGLGKHVDDTLAKHSEEHSNKVNDEHERRQSGREERKDKAESLGERLVKAIKVTGQLKGTTMLTSGAPEELDNGTLMVAHLEPIGTYEEAINAVCNAKYVNEGPVISKYNGKQLSPDDVKKMKLDYGLVVNVSLHSQDEELGIKTEHQVHVGNLLDPESILVPESTDEDRQFAVIGEDDDRFAAIIDLVKDFFESDAQKIRKELEQVS